MPAPCHIAEILRPLPGSRHFKLNLVILCRGSEISVGGGLRWQVAKELGIVMSGADVDGAMAEMDEDGSGEVDLHEPGSHGGIKGATRGYRGYIGRWGAKPLR